MNKYIASSIRAYSRSDEAHNTIYSELFLDVGDCIELDGIDWIIEEVII